MACLSLPRALHLLTFSLGRLTRSFEALLSLVYVLLFCDLLSCYRVGNSSRLGSYVYIYNPYVVAPLSFFLILTTRRFLSGFRYIPPTVAIFSGTFV